MSTAQARTTAVLSILDITKVEIHHDKANTRSESIPRALGFRFDGRALGEIKAPAEEGVDQLPDGNRTPDALDGGREIEERARMKFGYLSHNDANGIRPGHLAAELESRGFDSIWMPEHSHIPADRKTPYPAGGELPSSYYRMMDPMISLMAAAQGSASIELYTGICLVHEHDLLDLACAAATLDVLTNGRFHLGIGVGWNEEELANHRPDLPFKQRYSAMRERVAALRNCWQDEISSFAGRWDSFTESHVYPKPVNGTVPVALGNAGPVGIKHAADYADEWCPIDGSMLNTSGKPDVAGAIALFRQLATDAGRNPDDIPITIHSFRVNLGRFEQYAELGVERIVLFPPSMNTISTDATLTHLDMLATEVIEKMR